MCDDSDALTHNVVAPQCVKGVASESYLCCGSTLSPFRECDDIGISS